MAYNKDNFSNNVIAAMAMKEDVLSFYKNYVIPNHIDALPLGQLLQWDDDDDICHYFLSGLWDDDVPDAYKYLQSVFKEIYELWDNDRDNVENSENYETFISFCVHWCNDINADLIAQLIQQKQNPPIA